MRTLLIDRGGNTDFPSGKIPEAARESNSYKCSDFNRKIDGKVQSEESNQTGEVQMISPADSV